MAADTPDAQRQHVLHGLFDAHHGWLLGRIRRKLAQTAVAEELASETFLQVVAGKLEPSLIREPRAFLTRIAQRLLFHHYRDRELELAYLERMAAWPEELSPAPEERVALLQAVAQLDRALSQLPVAARQAFLLNQFEGMGYADIAAQLGVSERTVTRYMAQALRLLAASELWD